MFLKTGFDIFYHGFSIMNCLNSY